MLGIWVDSSNLYRSCKEHLDGKLDYEKLWEKIPPGDVILARVFGCQREGDAEGFMQALEKAGWESHFKEARQVAKNTWKGDCDIDIAMDIVSNIDGVDTVVLCTGDGDMVPLIRWLQELGVSVHIIGCKISHTLTLASCVELEKGDMLNE